MQKQYIVGKMFTVHLSFHIRLKQYLTLFFSISANFIVLHIWNKIILINKYILISHKCQMKIEKFYV